MLPVGASVESLLDDTLLTQFSMTPLSQFGEKVHLKHFTPEFRRMKELEEIMALIE